MTLDASVHVLHFLFVDSETTSITVRVLFKVGRPADISYQ